MRLDKAEDCSIQKVLGNPIKNTLYWCKLKLAQEKGLLFCQTRSHAIVLHDTLPAVLHRESGMHEDKGCAIPKGTFNSKSTTGCTQTECANRSTRSTRTRCKNIL